MKKFLFFLIIVVISFPAIAQDVIVKNDGSTILCKIVEVNNSEVVYLKWSDLSGPRYVMDRSIVSNINYQDGKQDKLNTPTSNAYAPGIQQTGEAQYNDKALLAMDKARFVNEDIKRLKKYRSIGWIVGGGCIILGAGAIVGGILMIENYNDTEGLATIVCGGVLTATGAVIMGTYLTKARKLSSTLNILETAHIYKQEINLRNGKYLYYNYTHAHAN